MTRALVALALLVPAAGADWPQFRGPGGTGTGPTAPVEWGPEKNVRWKADLPGRGLSSPVVAGGVAYVTACSGAAEDRLHVLAFDVATGKQKWHRQFWATGSTLRHPKTAVAAATPVVAGGRVFAPFASGDLFCLDGAGLPVWVRSLGSDYPGVVNQIGAAASPVAHGDLLVVPMENAGASFVVAVDQKTGANRWKIAREKEPNWVTPFLWDRGKETDLVLQTGKGASGHDPATGKERWRVAKPDLAKIPSPVADGDLLLLAGRQALVAVRAEVAWRAARAKPATATPLVAGGNAYVLTSAGLLCAVRLSDGKELWQERVKGPFSASPVLAGGKLYAAAEGGAVTVVNVSDGPQVLAVNDLKEPLLATPAVADGTLLLRTEGRLYCIATR